MDTLTTKDTIRAYEVLKANQDELTERFEFEEFKIIGFIPPLE